MHVFSTCIVRVNIKYYPNMPKYNISVSELKKSMVRQPGARLRRRRRHISFFLILQGKVLNTATLPVLLPP